MIYKKFLNTPVIISIFFVLITGVLLFFFYNNTIKIIITPKQETIIQAKEVSTVQILVATNDIVTGKRILSDDLSWRAWPKSLLNQEYITFDENSDRIQSLTGGIAKMPIISGEPIIEGKIDTIDKSVDKNRTDLTLKKGMRAVSVPISTKSYGFILPRDFVDVILTADNDPEKILENIKVLGIADGSAHENTATLEVTPEQAKLLAWAANNGQLKLSLVSFGDKLNAN